MNSLFTRLLTVLALAAGVCFAPLSLAQGTSSTPYQTIDPPLPSDSPGKIEVLEFFAYSCPHCAAIEPLAEAWVKAAPANVVFKRVPIAFNAAMKPMQQLYYTLAAMGRLDLHPKVFTAIHTENKQLFKENDIVDWVGTQGVDKAKFKAIFDSFAIDAETKRANQLSEAYKVEGTPSFTVGGKYLTSPVLAGNSYAGAIAELDKLLAMVNK